MKAPRAAFFAGWCLVPAFLAAQGAPGQPGEDKVLKDLLELMNTPVVSASRTPERLIDAPATVIVLSRSDLEGRGYTELSQILDDLPGMEVVRSYGANYFKNYWRGYRNDIGDPFLVMVDGVAFNHLWFNTADTPLVSYPIAAVERVEVVYGPASAVYGTNAFMGVINLITRKAPPGNGATVRGTLTTGSFGARVADLQALVRSGELTFSLAARSDKGGLDEDAAERYEYTRSRYYADRGLWGSVVDDGGRAGSAQSDHQHGALDLRVAWGATEFGLQRLWTSNGYGTAYAADQSQAIGKWIRPELSFHLKQGLTFGDRIASTLLLRYRRSDVDDGSFDVESYYGYGSGAATVLTHYEVLNSSLAFTQDFEIKVNDRLALNTGLRFEQKTLQKSYATATGGAKPTGSLGDANHFAVSDRGLYLQARYTLNPSNRFFAGLRSDHNSVYGAANTVRGGYVGNFGPWGLKALYGQAYQEPTARLLYGATSGTGSNTGLRPETSNTAEISGTYTQPALSLSLSVYAVTNHGRIQKVGDEVVNSGDQDVRGMDVGVQWLVPARGVVNQWKVWGWYSRIFRAEDIAGHTGAEQRTRSGDLADDKVWVGTTLTFRTRLSLSLTGRIIGPRPTVQSNPIREVPGYATFDLALAGRDLWKKGLGLSLRVANLTGKDYFHPGLRDAGAGTRPGGFDAAGLWSGSASYYNSLLPQPGRSVQLSLNLAF
ncbi:MAG: TonB-dependent receptor [Holophagaceae bacterium]|nr:TonB-dependent receptor [Holophagaceae bacterium]